MIDINKLKKEMKKMEPRQLLYEAIKLEMIKRGRWKYRPRGISKPEDDH